MGDERGQEAVEAVARAAADVLGRGVALDRGVADFLESSLGTFDPGEMMEALERGDSPEAQCALELVFFPDRDMRAALEPVLERAGLEAEQEGRVARRLAELLPRASLALPDGGSLALGLDERLAGLFVSRLKAWRRLPGKVAAGLAEIFDPKRADRIKVRLRLARCDFPDGLGEFVLDLARAGRANPDGLERLLGELLPLFEELIPGEDVYGFLMDAKRTMAAHLKRADFNDRAWRGNTFETLMAQGLRLPHVDRIAFARTMAAIDEACLAVYGRTEYFDRPLADADHGRFAAQAGAKRFIHMFMDDPPIGEDT